MQELTFEIMGISSERRMYGKTGMRLMCTQDNVLVDIEIPNLLSNDKNFIRQKAIEEYNKYIELTNNKNILGIGDIV